MTKKQNEIGFILEKSEIKDFSKNEIEIAKKMLTQIDSNFLEDNIPIKEQKNNIDYDDKFNISRLNKAIFLDCNFNNSFFNGTSASESSFVNCTFKKCFIESAGFKGSYFSKSKLLENTYVKNCGFENSYYDDVEIKDVKVSASSLFDMNLDNCILENVEFDHCDFEGSIFNNLHISNTDFTKCGIDYVLFRNVTLIDTILPLIGVLHTFNGLDCIKKNRDVCYLKTSIGGRKITAREFLESLESLLPYFYETHDFFALANINIFFNEQDKAFEYILQGLHHNIKQKNFKILRCLCQLASYNHFFQKTELLLLYDALNTHNKKLNLNKHENRMFLIEKDHIKRFLIDQPFQYFDSAQMTITVNTNIFPNNHSTLGQFYTYLDTTIKQAAPHCSYSISLRHNSPIIYEILISDALSQVIEVGKLMFFGLASISLPIVEFILLMKQKEMLEIQKEQSGKEMKNHHLERELIEKDIELKNIQLENEKLKQELLKKSITQANIQPRVVSMHYNLADINNIFPEEYRFFNFKSIRA
jgi:uncharacterized protein YjbI with pentapeptide repeats